MILCLWLHVGDLCLWLHVVCVVIVVYVIIVVYVVGGDGGDIVTTQSARKDTTFLWNMQIFVDNIL